MSTLSNANSTLFIQVENLYPVPQQIQGFSTDDAFAAADVQPTEAIMGVDGKLSFGFTPYPFVFDVTLQADSPSNAIFDNTLAAQKAAQDVYIINGALNIPGLGVKAIFTRGSITSASPMATGKKMLQPRKYTVTYEGFSLAPI